MNLSYFSPKEAYSLRRRFVDKFVDKTLDSYRYSMGHGDFYGTNSHSLCLWESFKSYSIISKDVALDMISKMPVACVTWDRSPSDLSANLRKTRLIKLCGEELSKELGKGMGNNPFEPADVYVFDPELNFHITLTHKHISGFGDVCITSLEDVPDPGISPAFRDMFKNLKIAQFS